MKTIFCMLAVLCLYAGGLAQPIPSPAAGLQPGDQMPDVLLKNTYNYPLKTVAFSAFQKDLTIVDFWATWCGSCIESFPKMHALQSKFAGRLQVLMANGSPGEDSKKLDAFFQRRKARTGKDFTLPYLVGDSLFARMFPHKTIPHCVWLDEQRRVVAITESAEVNEANIAAFLNGEKPALSFKNDALLFEAGDELLGSEATESDDLLYRSFILAGKKELGNKILYEAAGPGKISSLRVINYHLFGLYQMSNPGVFKYGINRVQIDSAISALFQPGEDGSRGKHYSYQLETRPITRSQALQWMAADLERYFNVTAVNEERKIPCFVVSAGKGIARLYTRNGPASVAFNSEYTHNKIVNSKPEVLWGILEQLLKKPLVDETGLTRNIDLEFPAGFLQMSPQQIMFFLARHGLLLQETERPLTVSRLKSISTQ